MEENRGQDPFARFEQSPEKSEMKSGQFPESPAFGGRFPYGSGQPSETPYMPQQTGSLYVPRQGGMYAPQQGGIYSPQPGNVNSQQPVAPISPQQAAPMPMTQQPVAPVTQQPGMPYAPNQSIGVRYTARPESAQDLSQYSSYQPGYYSDGQSSVQQMDTPFGAATYSPYGNRSNTSHSSSYGDTEIPVRKRKAGPILGILGAVILIAGLVTAWMLGWFQSRSGIYVWDDYANADMTAKIEIDGEKAVITMKSKEDIRTVECDVEFSSDTVKFVYGGKVLTCDYDRRNGLITEKDDIYTGVDLVFEKE